MGRIEEAYSDFSNVETDGTPDLSLYGSLINKLNVSPEPSRNVPDNDNSITIEDINELAYDGSENLAGLLCHKLKDSTLQSSSSQTYSWIDYFSEGGLSKPSPTFISCIQEFNKMFLETNNEGLVSEKNFIHNLVMKSNNIDCPEKVKQLFFRSRMFFRIKELNRALRYKKKQQKEMETNYILNC